MLDLEDFSSWAILHHSPFLLFIATLCIIVLILSLITTIHQHHISERLLAGAGVDVEFHKLLW
jgi:hypothetical protein